MEHALKAHAFDEFVIRGRLIKLDTNTLSKLSELDRRQMNKSIGLVAAAGSTDPRVTRRQHIEIVTAALRHDFPDIRRDEVAKLSPPNLLAAALAVLTARCKLAGG